jgi:hypothetical protein
VLGISQVAVRKRLIRVKKEFAESSQGALFLLSDSERSIGKIQQLGLQKVYWIEILQSAMNKGNI